MATRASSVTFEAPTDVRAVVEFARTAARTATAITVSLAGVEVAEAILGRRPLEHRHVRAMATHFYSDASITGGMFGGTPGREWARKALVATANDELRAIIADAAEGVRAEHRQAGELRALSAQLQRIDGRFRAKVQGVLAQSMRRAESHARAKVNVRASKATAAKRASIASDLRTGRITPAVLAAVNTTDDELLGQLFEDAGDELADLFEERQQSRRNALLAALAAYGLTMAELDRRWGIVERQRTEEIRQFTQLAMFNEARARLQAGSVGAQMFAVQGELPFDTSVPGSVANAVVRLADGATLAPTSTTTTAAGPEVLDAGGIATGPGAQPLEGVDGDNLVDDVIGTYTDGGSEKILTWLCGDPARPFEPHQDLNGTSFTSAEFYEVCAKDPNEFPYGTYQWCPGDHAGCQCELVVEYVPAGGSPAAFAASASPAIDVARSAPSIDVTTAALVRARARVAAAAGLLRPALTAAGEWDEELHPRDASGKFGAGDGDGSSTPAYDPDEAKALKLNDEQATAAAEAGIPLAEFKDCLKEVPEAKAAMRGEAKAMQYEVASRLDAMQCGKGQFPRPPKDVMTNRERGEWDWYKALGPTERQHLQQFFAPTSQGDEGRSGLDVKLEEAKERGPSEIQDMNPSEFGEYFHGLATQYMDYGLMAQGKPPVYGDAKEYLPGFRETGIDPHALFGSDKIRAAEGVWNGRQSSASKDSSEREDHAFRLLGSGVHYTEENNAPWQMGYQSWSAEVQDLEYRQTEGSLTSTESARLDALVPSDLDGPGASLEDLYAQIVETARTAGLEVPDHAHIPW